MKRYMSKRSKKRKPARLKTGTIKSALHRYLNTCEWQGLQDDPQDVEELINSCAPVSFGNNRTSGRHAVKLIYVLTQMHYQIPLRHKFATREFYSRSLCSGPWSFMLDRKQPICLMCILFIWLFPTSKNELCKQLYFLNHIQRIAPMN